MLKFYKAKYLLGNSSELWKVPRPCSHAGLILSIEQPYDLEYQPPLCIILLFPNLMSCTDTAVLATPRASASFAQKKQDSALPFSTHISSFLPQGLDVGHHGNTVGIAHEKPEGPRYQHGATLTSQDRRPKINYSPFSNLGAEFCDSLHKPLGRVWQGQALSPLFGGQLYKALLYQLFLLPYVPQSCPLAHFADKPPAYKSLCQALLWGKPRLRHLETVRCLYGSQFYHRYIGDNNISF